MESLREHVERWLEETAEGYDGDVEAVYEDLMRGGCASGMVGHLISYADTVTFYKVYQEEIKDLLIELMESTGLSPAELFREKWNETDPFAEGTMNRNLLAWFGFEETARRIVEEGIENE
jgi:hypothetical protein